MNHILYEISGLFIKTPGTDNSITGSMEIILGETDECRRKKLKRIIGRLGQNEDFAKALKDEGLLDDPVLLAIFHRCESRNSINEAFSAYYNYFSWELMIAGRINALRKSLRIALFLLAGLLYSFFILVFPRIYEFFVKFSIPQSTAFQMLASLSETMAKPAYIPFLLLVPVLIWAFTLLFTRKLEKSGNQLKQLKKNHMLSDLCKAADPGILLKETCDHLGISCNESILYNTAADSPQGSKEGHGKIKELYGLQLDKFDKQMKSAAEKAVLILFFIVSAVLISIAYIAGQPLLAVFGSNAAGIY